MTPGVVVLLIVLLVFGFGGPYYVGGPDRGPVYGTGGLGLVLLVLVVLYLLGYLGPAHGPPRL